MAQTRAYHVCKCGAWVWASQVKPGRTHCFCGRRWPQGPSSPDPKSPPRRPSQPPAAAQPKTPPGPNKAKKEEDRKLKRAVGTVWDQIPPEAQAKLQKAGWKGPTAKPKEAEDPMDPLLLLLKHHKAQLPDEVQTALEEATQAPEPTMAEKAQQSNRQIHLQGTIDETKESLRMQLLEMQETTSKIEQAEQAVVAAKEALAQAVAATPIPTETTADPMDIDSIMSQLGVTLTEEQVAKLSEIKATKRPWKAHLGCRVFHLGLQPTSQASDTADGPKAKPPAGNVPAETGDRQRSRSPVGGESGIRLPAVAVSGCGFPTPGPARDGGPCPQCAKTCAQLYLCVQYCVQCDELSLLDPKLRWEPAAAHPLKPSRARYQGAKPSADSLVSGSRYFTSAFCETSNLPASSQDAGSAPSWPNTGHPSSGSREVAPTPEGPANLRVRNPKPWLFLATKRRRAERRREDEKKSNADFWESWECPASGPVPKFPRPRRCKPACFPTPPAGRG